MKRVAVSVINDLNTDQRVRRTCATLTEEGFNVHLIGRILPTSQPLERPYSIKRFNLWANKGALFYALYNLRLFVHLLFRKVDLFYANDLDTLLPNYLVAKLKNKPLIYDAHEYFTGVPELESRPRVQRVWKRIESWIFPKLKYVITVNDSIADLYEKDYGIRPVVIRNVPDANFILSPVSRASLDLPTDHPILILQGAGINIDRGAEEVVEAMQYLDRVLLLIIGSGDVFDLLKEKIKTLQLEEKINILGRVPYEKLMQYTQIADLGISMDKDTNINYRYSLPNKLFDYIQAGVPVLASNLVEVRKVVEGFDVGIISENHDPAQIAEKINVYLNDKTTQERHRTNLQVAKSVLNWKTEQKQLLNLLQHIEY